MHTGARAANGRHAEVMQFSKMFHIQAATTRKSVNDGRQSSAADDQR